MSTFGLQPLKAARLLVQLLCLKPLQCTAAVHCCARGVHARTRTRNTQVVIVERVHEHFAVKIAAVDELGLGIKKGSGLMGGLMAHSGSPAGTTPPGPRTPRAQGAMTPLPARPVAAPTPPVRARLRVLSATRLLRGLPSPAAAVVGAPAAAAASRSGAVVMAQLVLLRLLTMVVPRRRACAGALMRGPQPWAAAWHRLCQRHWHSWALGRAYVGGIELGSGCACPWPKSLCRAAARYGARACTSPFCCPRPPTPRNPSTLTHMCLSTHFKV